LGKCSGIYSFSEEFLPFYYTMEMNLCQEKTRIYGAAVRAFSDFSAVRFTMLNGDDFF